MQSETTQIRSKQLSYLKMRVELIAWRIEEIGGMTPSVRAALPPQTVDIFGDLLYETGTPDETRLKTFESAVQEAEEALARDAGFWRSGYETLH
jgi:hypothetical protein